MLARIGRVDDLLRLPVWPVPDAELPRRPQGTSSPMRCLTLGAAITAGEVQLETQAGSRARGETQGSGMVKSRRMTPRGRYG